MVKLHEFYQHLRALAQSAVRTVLELVMREELDAFQIDVFTMETSCLTIVWATIQDIGLHKISFVICPIIVELRYAR